MNAIVFRLILICLLGASVSPQDVAQAAATERTPGEACPNALSSWTEAEVWAWNQVCAGLVADFDKREGVALTQVSPESSDGWTNDRTLSSAFLETIIMHDPFRSTLARAHRRLRIVKAWFKQKIDLENAKIDFELSLRQSRFEKRLILKDIKTEHGINLSGSYFNQGLNLHRGGIGGELNMTGVRFKGAMRMDTMEVDGNLFMGNIGDIVADQVSLRRAKIGGDLDMSESQIKSWMAMDSMVVGRDLIMRGIMVAQGVDLNGAKVGGQVDMSGAQFKSKLEMNSMEVGSDLNLRDGARFQEVDLIGAKVGDQLDMTGSVFTAKLIMDHIGIGGALLMHDSARFSEVVLRSAKIGTQLTMVGSEFKGRLNLSAMEVGGAVLMRAGNESGAQQGRSQHLGRGTAPDGSTGLKAADFHEVVLREAKIGANLELSGSTFDGKLDMESINVGGSLVMAGGNFTGPVGLMYAKIGSNLDLSSVKLPEIDLTGTGIAGELRLGWATNSDKQTKDGMYAWPERLELNGLNYARLVGFDAAPADIKTRGWTKWFLGWLNRDINYNQQSYEYLAGVLRKVGKYEMADDILYAGRERERKNAAGLRWWGLTLLNYLIGYGYGYRYFYSLLWVTCLVALGVLVLRLTGEHRKHPIPLGVAYSLDMLLPIVQLREFHYVKVDLSGPARHYFYFHKLMGYVLASFLIAGLSGLTR